MPQAKKPSLEDIDETAEKAIEEKRIDPKIDDIQETKIHLAVTQQLDPGETHQPEITDIPPVLDQVTPETVDIKTQKVGGGNQASHKKQLAQKIQKQDLEINQTNTTPEDFIQQAENHEYIIGYRFNTDPETIDETIDTFDTFSNMVKDTPYFLLQHPNDPTKGSLLMATDENLDIGTQKDIELTPEFKQQLDRFVLDEATNHDTGIWNIDEFDKAIDSALESNEIESITTVDKDGKASGHPLEIEKNIKTLANNFSKTVGTELRMYHQTRDGREKNLILGDALKLVKPGIYEADKNNLDIQDLTQNKKAAAVFEIKTQKNENQIKLENLQDNNELQNQLDSLLQLDENIESETESAVALDKENNSIRYFIASNHPEIAVLTEPERNQDMVDIEDRELSENRYRESLEKKIEELKDKPFPRINPTRDTKQVTTKDSLPENIDLTPQEKKPMADINIEKVREKRRVNATRDIGVEKFDHASGGLGSTGDSDTNRSLGETPTEYLTQVNDVNQPIDAAYGGLLHEDMGANFAGIQFNPIGVEIKDGKARRVLLPKFDQEKYKVKTGEEKILTENQDVETIDKYGIPEPRNYNEGGGVVKTLSRTTSRWRDTEAIGNSRDIESIGKNTSLAYTAWRSVSARDPDSEGFNEAFHNELSGILSDVVGREVTANEVESVASKTSFKSESSSVDIVLNDSLKEQVIEKLDIVDAVTSDIFSFSNEIDPAEYSTFDEWLKDEMMDVEGELYTDVLQKSTEFFDKNTRIEMMSNATERVLSSRGLRMDVEKNDVDTALKNKVSGVLTEMFPEEEVEEVIDRQTENLEIDSGAPERPDRREFGSDAGEVMEEQDTGYTDEEIEKKLEIDHERVMKKDVKVSNQEKELDEENGEEQSMDGEQQNLGRSF